MLAAGREEEKARYGDLILVLVVKGEKILKVVLEEKILVRKDDRSGAREDNISVGGRTTVYARSTTATEASNKTMPKMDLPDCKPLAIDSAAMNQLDVTSRPVSMTDGGQEMQPLHTSVVPGLFGAVER